MGNPTPSGFMIMSPQVNISMMMIVSDNNDDSHFDAHLIRDSVFSRFATACACTAFDMRPILCSFHFTAGS